MVRYTVPTQNAGTVTRTSAKHSIDGDHFSFIAVRRATNVEDQRRLVTFHRSVPVNGGGRGWPLVETVEIKPEHMTSK